MKRTSARVAFAVFAAFTLLLTGACVGVGVDGTVGVGYDAGYYEPYGYDYGGWGRGYGVGPWHGGDHRVDRGGHAPAYRPAPAGRSMPSLPSARPRGR